MIEFEAVEQGLERGEFFLEYLPTVDLESGRCVGAEALSRWRRADRVVQPLEFLQVVENTPLAGLLTYWVIEQLARDFRDWLKVNDAFISFNVPPEIIGRGGIMFAARTSGLLEVSDKIVMEITERGVPDRLAVESLNRAVDRGMRVALDDVGTGEASLFVLARCNVEMIKLERQLVGQARAGEPLPDKLQVLTSLARSGKVKVVAEGIETADHAEAMRSAGVRLAQGYHFSRPVPADAFKRYFAEKSPA